MWRRQSQQASLKRFGQIQRTLQSALRHPEARTGDPVAAEPHPGLRRQPDLPGERICSAQLSKPMEAAISAAQKKVELITAKIRDEDIQNEFAEAFSGVHATLTQLSKLYILEGFTEESEALLSDDGRLIQEFEEDYEL